MSIQVQTRINEKLRSDLQRIATEQFEGNLSMVVRLALKEFRDRRSSGIPSEVPLGFIEKDDPDFEATANYWVRDEKV